MSEIYSCYHSLEAYVTFKHVTLYIHILFQYQGQTHHDFMSMSWSHSGIQCQFLAKCTLIIILV